MSESRHVYAGFWIRVWASIIDRLLALVVLLPVLVGIYGTSYLKSNRLLYGGWDVFFSYVLPAIATVLFWKYKQATPGKMAVSARIVDAETGEPPSVGKCIGRYFAYLVSTLPIFLGLIWVAFDRRKQGWHDKLAGTVVVRTARSGSESVTFPRAPNQPLHPPGASGKSL